MKSGIYKIINPIGEIYIGYSGNIHIRFLNYKNGKAKKQKLIFESFEKYGFENHKFEIIKYCKPKLFRKLEKYYINLFDSFEKGLNSNKGGGGIVNHSLKSKKLISLKGKLNKGKRIVSHRKGKKLPEEHRLKLMGKNKGEPKPTLYKPILQFDLQDNFIKEYKSIESAAKNIKGNPTAINNALIKFKKGIKATSGGYIWKYKN